MSSYLDWRGLERIHFLRVLTNLRLSEIPPDSHPTRPDLLLNDYLNLTNPPTMRRWLIDLIL